MFNVLEKICLSLADDCEFRAPPGFLLVSVP
jgi:hypothetical protein